LVAPFNVFLALALLIQTRSVQTIDPKTPTICGNIRLVGGPFGLELLGIRRTGPKWHFDGSKVVFTVQGGKGNPPTLSIAKLPNNEIEPAYDKRGVGSLVVPLKLEQGSASAGWYVLNADITKAIRSDDSSPLDLYGPFPERIYLPASGAADDLAAVRKKWLGKKVWVMGAAANTGPESSAQPELWDPRDPAVIVGIARLHTPIVELGGPPCWPALGDEGAFPIVVQNPLKITLKLPRIKVRHVTEGVGRAGPFFVPALAEDPGSGMFKFAADAPIGPAPQTGWILAADDWHLGMMVTAESPLAILKLSSPEIRKAFSERRVVKGMPRELVARLLGYPSYDKSISELNKDRGWIYMGMSTISYDVGFNKDKVNFSGLDGELPGD
jgi:hypothetical protein